MESALMSGLHMELPDGRKLFIEVDGTVINENDEIPVEFCDGCEKFQATTHGKYITNQGEKLLWLCQACK